MKSILPMLLATFILSVFCHKSFGQAECVPWGGLRGIRIDGELMAFTTGIRDLPKSLPRKLRKSRASWRIIRYSAAQLRENRNTAY